MVTTVADAARHLDVTSGPHDTDRLSLPPPSVRYEDAVESLDVSGLRVGWSDDLGFAAVDPEVRGLARAGAEELCAAAGLDLVEVDVALTDPVHTWLAAGALSLWLDIDEKRDWPGRADDLTPFVRRDFEGNFDRPMRTLVPSLRRRLHLQEEMAELFSGVDVLLTPTTAVVGFAAAGPPPTLINGREVRSVDERPVHDARQPVLEPRALGPSRCELRGDARRPPDHGSAASRRGPFAPGTDLRAARARGPVTHPGDAPPRRVLTRVSHLIPSRRILRRSQRPGFELRRRHEGECRGGCTEGLLGCGTSGPVAHRRRRLTRSILDRGRDARGRQPARPRVPGRGLVEGDVVASLSRNTAELLALLLAVFQAGWHYVPLNTHLTADEVAYILARLRRQGARRRRAYADVASAAADDAGVAAEARLSVGAIHGFTPLADALADQPGTTPDRPGRPGSSCSTRRAPPGDRRRCSGDAADVRPRDVGRAVQRQHDPLRHRARRRRGAPGDVADVPHVAAVVRVLLRCTSSTPSC